MIKFSLIIPAYNEEQAIKSTVNGLKKYLSSNFEKSTYEIIVVNDGSTDNTKEEVEMIEDIKIINISENRGYGAAIKKGITQSSYDWILIFDADSTYPIEAISEIIKIAPDYDMVVGARTKAGAQIPLSRKPAKWFINKLANYLCETKIPDLNSGLRIMKKSLLEKFLFILPNGFSLTTTITLASLTNGYNVKYIPIDYHRRSGKSKIKPIKDTLNFVQLIIKTMLYFNPFKIFTTTSFLLAFSGIIIFLVTYLFSDKTLDTTATIFILSAVQVFVMGMMADLIIKSQTLNK